MFAKLGCIMQLSPELMYLLLVVGLFIVSRGLQRFRIPGAISSLGMGAIANIFFHAFHDDPTIQLFGTFGIVTMFLFAGLEVDVEELRQGARVLLTHVTVQVLLLFVAAWVFERVFALEYRAALLFGLATLTPSTGFILDTLPGLGLSAEERYWVKSKAIAAELVALGALFFTVQSGDLKGLSISAVALVVMIIILPPLFKGFDRLIAPFAPRTEFTFLVLVALLCSYVTRELGVYYLVGAFVVGLTAIQMRKSIPGLSSERLTIGVELFASFFIPFYFFKSGLHLNAEHFSLESLGIGLALLVVLVPLRILRVAAHRHYVLKEEWSSGLRIGTAVVPTLVFTIVIAGILQEKFALPPTLFGGLIVYTLVNTMIPGIALRMPTPDFENPKVLTVNEALPEEAA